MRTKSDKESKLELNKVEEELSNLVAEENYNKIKTELKNTNGEEAGMNAGKLWKIKKKLSPRPPNNPTAMVDKKGNLVTSAAGLESLALEHYKNVLHNREINEELKHIQQDKEYLYNLRINIAKANKSEPWNMNDLERVLSHLKANKCRDPLGNTNEIFKTNVAGDDLKEAILLLVNRIKDMDEFPEALRLCNISSIYKKGKRNNFDNYRGVFRVIIFRSILDRLVYNDIYPTIDSQLSDANVGSRKGRNVRDNLFALYAVINSIKSGNEEACDLGVYDVTKCFDALWNQECLNDLWDVGCQNDKLNVLAQGNTSARVAVKTPKEPQKE